MKKILFSIVLAAGLFTLTKAQSLHFDGVDDSVATSINCDNTVMPDMTWEAWVKPTNPGNTNWQMIFACENGSWDRFLAIQGGHFSMGVGDGPFQPTLADFNQWQHVAVVYTGDQVIFYKNGVQYIYGGVVDTATQESNTAPLLLGEASYGLPYGGNIDEARVWNVALSQAQIQANMANCSFSAPQAGLVAYYNFNQGNPNGNNAGLITLGDGSGNGQDGTLNNFLLNGTTSNWVDDFSSITAGITITASATTVYSGATITFNSAVANPATTTSYQWMVNGVNVPGATASNYSTNTLATDDTVSCMLVSGASCVSNDTAYSNDIVVTILPLPPPGAGPDILHYRFNETGTAVVNYASAATALTDTATIIGGMTQTGNGFCGGALVGTGAASSTAYLDTYYTLDIGTASWTISMWTSNVQGSNTTYVFGEANNTTFRCFTNGVAGSGNWILRGAGLTDTYVNGGATMTPHLITFVYDNVMNTVYGYLDGVLVTSVTQSTPNLVSTSPLKVGGYGTNLGLNAGGLMDEFRMYRRALSATEVASLMDPSIRRTDNVTACDTLMSFNGTQTWTTTGTYTDTIHSAVSCDTVVTVNLTINNSSSHTINATVCDSYTAPDGMVYTISGTQTAVIPTVAGCDSMITINLTVNTSPTVSINYPTATSMECEGSLDTLTASGAVSYTWSTGSTSDTTIVTHIAGTTSWSVIGTDNNGCTHADTVLVTGITPFVNVTVDLSTIDSTCVNYPAFALATASPSGGAWSGTGVTGSDFDPAAAGIGMHAITYTADPVCNYAATDSIYVSGCVGIKERNGDAGVALYPNPNNGSFTLRSEAEGTFFVLNELGQVLMTLELNASNNYEFNGKELPTGVYFVTGKNNSFRMKMVVTK